MSSLPLSARAPRPLFPSSLLRLSCPLPPCASPPPPWIARSAAHWGWSVRLVAPALCLFAPLPHHTFCTQANSQGLYLLCLRTCNCNRLYIHRTITIHANRLHVLLIYVAYAREEISCHIRWSHMSFSACEYAWWASSKLSLTMNCRISFLMSWQYWKASEYRFKLISEKI